MDVLVKPLLIIFVISATIKFLIDIVKYVKNLKLVIPKVNFQKTKLFPEDFIKYKKFIKDKKLSLYSKIRLRYKKHIVIFNLNIHEPNKKSIDFELQDEYLVINCSLNKVLSENLLKKTTLIFVGFSENSIKTDIKDYQKILSDYLNKKIIDLSGYEFLNKYQKAKNIGLVLQNIKSHIRENQNIIIGDNYKLWLKKNSNNKYRSRNYSAIAFALIAIGFMISVKYFETHEKIYLPKYTNTNIKISDYNNSFGPLLRNYYLYENLKKNTKNEKVKFQKNKLNTKIEFLVKNNIHRVNKKNKLDILYDVNSKQIFKIGHEKYHNDIKTDISENIPFIMISSK